MPVRRQRQEPTAQQTAGAPGNSPPPSEVVTFSSADGTPIAAFKSGTGPALVAIHGTAADHTVWQPVVPLLAPHFTVYAVDRRGRGRSGDAPEYSLERECDDVVAVVDGIGGPVHLYGHSFGGRCALEAAVRTRHLASLVVYEGGGARPQEVRDMSDDLSTQLEVLIAAGQREEALSLFMVRGARLSPDELDLLRQSSVWASRLAALHTIPRELRAVNKHEPDLERFRAITVPTLLLVGGRTEARQRELFLQLKDVIPESQVRELAGQGHAAHQTATQLFADVLTEFLLSVRH